MAVASHEHTLEEFTALPEKKPALEFSDGMITQKVSPKGQHSALQVDLVKRLDAAGMAGKFARSFSELCVTFGGASRVPDIAIYRWERVPLDSSGRVVNDFTVPPDIVIEIASPEQSVNALTRRCFWYVASGVELALLVDPADESVAVFRSETLPVFWRGNDRIEIGEILPDFRLTVQELFATLQMV